jgi:hypothetical protein
METLADMHIKYLFSRAHARPSPFFMMLAASEFVIRKWSFTLALFEKLRLQS